MRTIKAHFLKVRDGDFQARSHALSTRLHILQIYIKNKYKKYINNNSNYNIIKQHNINFYNNFYLYNYLLFKNLKRASALFNCLFSYMMQKQILFS